jgi:hypothetical protein
MTKEEIIAHYNECNEIIDKLANERDILRAKSQQCEDERQKWARRRYAWDSIYLNMFDEPMPPQETDIPIYGNQMTVEDVIKIKEES